MVEVTRRLEQWKAKYTPERVKATLDAARDEVQKRYLAATAELCLMEEQTRTVLNAAGIHTPFYVPHLNHARQLCRLSRKRGISGESFAMAAQVLLDKWAARGCDADVLARIRTEIFNIGAAGEIATGTDNHALAPSPARLTNVRSYHKMQPMSAQGRPALTDLELMCPRNLLLGGTHGSVSAELLFRKCGPVVDEYLLEVLSGTLVVDNQRSVAIAQHAVARPVLAA